MTPTAQLAARNESSCAPSKPPHFLVGRDRSGQWIARDRNGRRGGVFATRAQALRFAWHERGEGPGAVVLVPGNLELFEASARWMCASSPNEERVLVEQVSPEV